MDDYLVTIHEQPFCYKVKAESEEDAEYKALDAHSAGSYDDIGEVEVKKITTGDGE